MLDSVKCFSVFPELIVRGFLPVAKPCNEPAEFSVLVF